MGTEGGQKVFLILVHSARSPNLYGVGGLNHLVNRVHSLVDGPALPATHSSAFISSKLVYFRKDVPIPPIVSLGAVSDSRLNSASACALSDKSSVLFWRGCEGAGAAERVEAAARTD